MLWRHFFSFAVWLGVGFGSEAGAMTAAAFGIRISHRIYSKVGRVIGIAALLLACAEVLFTLLVAGFAYLLSRSP